METVFGQMEAAMGQSLAEELGPVPVSFARQAQLRFAGQRHYVQTGVAPGADLAQVRNAFESLYRRRFGHVDEGAPIEIVGLTLTGTAGITRPPLEQLRAESLAEAAPRSREVYFAERSARLTTPVYKIGRAHV